MKRFVFLITQRGAFVRCTILSVLGVCLLGSDPCQAQSELLQKYAIKRFGSTRLRHGSQIQCLAFSPDDKLLAAGGGNDFVRVWNIQTGAEQRRFKEQWVTALAFSPGDGGTLAAAGAFRKIRLWNMADGSERVIEGQLSPIKSLTFSADGTMLAAGGQDGTILLWQWQTNRIKPLDVLVGHLDEVVSLAFSRQGDRLASAGTDRTIRQWSTDRSEKLPTIETPCGVTGLAYSADDKILISAGDDYVIRLWDPATGKQLGVLKPDHRKEVTGKHNSGSVSLLLSRDGKTLVSAGQDRAIRLWDFAEKKPGRVHPRDNNDGDALALSGDGKLLAYAGRRNTIHIVDASSGRELFPDIGPSAPIAALGISPDGKMLISAGEDRLLHLWDTASARKLASHDARSAGDLTVPLALAGLLDNGNFKRGETIGSMDPILAVAGSMDGKSFATGHRSGKVGLHRLSSDKVVHEALAYPGKPDVLAFSQDGKTLAVSGNSNVVLFDVASGKQIQQFVTRGGPLPTQPRVACLAFSPSGKYLAVGCYDGIARLFDPATGSQFTFFEGHLSVVLSVAFSPDGRTLATGSFDQTARIWEVFNGPGPEPRPGSRREYEADTGLIASFTGHAGPVQAVCFAPDGRSLYTGSSDTTILHWDVTRISRDGVLPTVALTKADQDDAWTKMATLDSALGQEAAWKLATDKESAAYLAGKLFYVDSAQLDRLFFDLNDDSFAIRSKATEELARFCRNHGMWMRGRLEDAVRNPASEEVRYRAEQLLEKLLELPSTLSLQQERIRVHRAMLILEQAANPAALEALRSLARSAPERHLQAEAQLALDRLKKGTKSE